MTDDRSMNNILLVCGGSGGHIAPGLAVAEELQSRNHRCFICISQKKIDRRFIEKYPQFQFITINSLPFSKSPLKFLKFVFSQSAEVFRSFKILKENRVNCTVCFGGFTSLGLALASKLKKIPIILHESNIIAGKSTRALSRLADLIILPSSGIKNKLGVKNTKLINLGVPLRKELCNMDKAIAKKILGINGREKLLLVLGGSQGAKALTDWVLENVKRFARHRINCHCLGGLNTKNEKITDGGFSTTFEPFSDDMNILLHAADMVIARAGASTIAECIACHTPMILVPYPLAAENHQEENANQVEKNGCAVKINQNQINMLFDMVDSILSDDEKLGQMAYSCEAMEEVNVAAKIADRIEILTKPLKS
ncbi:MAG: UDP-N-acetylglucosamine--N-acetylmuramyl-(pentapeptide) pyrophosphoryl-undecaprenol N-acetylglucosamine transferase [Puniceicoccales bacterium]|jgi:UDP-N-acetylglucosamine--N-acetylmuramyl-(pentapeptide) pyrophosphoryl-undecaprenol N-acetylglucosamine transferase|nr:UDP-N-acetylglucosamine--N-acetylmuramyl-(pentapeptide) pyrophosphoryl-undecaprenol N-acetylglucosamine transferase [Puniceicoccales bacterium]